MSRISRWSLLGLCLVLALGMALPSQAAPASTSNALFLAELSEQAPCQLEPSSLVAKPDENKPVFKVIYPDCGDLCSDTRCAGKPTLSQCTTASGQPGFCHAVNQVCPNEPRRSPCTCRT
ncbi:MAG TPA: hypothetical protein VEL74_16285 [Thermoanaerobaculia bacterium]|nr:hypothetical protein [Thermoanaerobaculia bacterium]